MDGEHLEPWQASRIRDALFPGINYLARLRRRMEEVGFVAEDPLFRLVNKVYEALHELYNELHYRSCASGVGREPTEPP